MTKKEKKKLFRLSTHVLGQEREHNVAQSEELGSAS